MRTIYKYPFKVADDITIEMPVGAVILHAEVQAGTATMWAQVDPRAVKTYRRFRVIGTGHPFDPDRLTHVGTFQQPPFVWHLFEKQT